MVLGLHGSCLTWTYRSLFVLFLWWTSRRGWIWTGSIGPCTDDPVGCHFLHPWWVLPFLPVVSPGRCAMGFERMDRKEFFSMFMSMGWGSIFHVRVHSGRTHQPLLRWWVPSPSSTPSSRTSATFLGVFLCRPGWSFSGGGDQPRTIEHPPLRFHGCCCCCCCWSSSCFLPCCNVFT